MRVKYISCGPKKGASKRRLAYMHRRGSRDFGIIFLHGLKSDMQGTKCCFLDDYCAAKDISFLRFDYFGHGLSGGEFEQGLMSIWLSDALEIFDNLSSGRQIVIGSSLGSWLMFLLALKRKSRIKAMIGIASAIDATENLIYSPLSLSEKEELRKKGKINIPSAYAPEGYDISYALIKDGREHLLLGGKLRFDCAIRLLHGLADKEVDWQFSVETSRHITSPDLRIILLAGEDHSLSGELGLCALKEELDKLCS